MAGHFSLEEAISPGQCGGVEPVLHSAKKLLMESCNSHIKCKISHCV